MIENLKKIDTDEIYPEFYDDSVVMFFEIEDEELVNELLDIYFVTSGADFCSKEDMNKKVKMEYGSEAYVSSVDVEVLISNEDWENDCVEEDDVTISFAPYVNDNGDLTSAFKVDFPTDLYKECRNRLISKVLI